MAAYAAAVPSPLPTFKKIKCECDNDQVSYLQHNRCGMRPHFPADTRWRQRPTRMRCISRAVVLFPLLFFLLRNSLLLLLMLLQLLRWRLLRLLCWLLLCLQPTAVLF